MSSAGATGGALKKKAAKAKTPAVKKTVADYQLEARRLGVATSGTKEQLKGRIYRKKAAKKTGKKKAAKKKTTKK